MLHFQFEELRIREDIALAAKAACRLIFLNRSFEPFQHFVQHGHSPYGGLAAPIFGGTVAPLARPLDSCG
jgi:hypothetical protein